MALDKNKIERIKEIVKENNPEAIYLDMDSALIGYSESTFRFIYSYEKLIQHWVDNDKMTISEAKEWFDYNVEHLTKKEEGIIVLSEE